jgi:hypothetical protein
MSSPQSKKSRGANILTKAARASNFRANLSDHHNFTEQELLGHFMEHDKVLNLMIDASTAFSFSEEQKQKLIRGINNTSARLEQLRSLLLMKSTQNSSSNFSPRSSSRKGTLKR